MRLKTIVLGLLCLCATSCHGQSTPINIKDLSLPAARYGSGEKIVKHKAYTVSFNKDARIPNWVAWELTPDRCTGPYTRKDANYDWDPAIKGCPGRSDYQYSTYGYTRGHMCPAMNNRNDIDMMTECFYMSNMCPQSRELNEGTWQSLEIRCATYAKWYGKVYIVCGPVLSNPEELSEIGRGITCPYRFFKCILRYGTDANGNPDKSSIGYLFTQDNDRVRVSVNEIEALTGLDLFCNLPDDEEETIESNTKETGWR